MASPLPKTPRVGLLYWHEAPELATGYCAEMCHYFFRRAQRGQLTVDVLGSQQHADGRYEVGPGLAEVRAKNFDALVTIGLNDAEYLAELAQLEPPAVSLDHQPPPTLPMDAVTFDGLQGGYAAGKILTQRGHKDIVFISDFVYDRRAPAGEERLLEDETSLERRTGVQRAALEAGAGMWPVVPYYGRPGYPAMSALRKRLENLCAEYGHPPSAVVAHNFDLLEVVKDYGQAHGLKIPGDISLLSFHATSRHLPDSPEAQKISHMRYRWHEMSSRGWALLKERLEGRVPREAPQRHVALPGEYVECGSVREAQPPERQAARKDS